MNSLLLNELIKRIKENCAGSNHELTQDQLDDVRDSLLPFANRFDAMEEICELTNSFRSQLPEHVQDKLSEMFDI